MEKKPLKCSWFAPFKLNGVLQNYHINIEHGGKIIHSAYTRGTKYKERPDFVLTQEQNYTVIVSALTHAMGKSTKSRINFVYSGKIFF